MRERWCSATIGGRIRRGGSSKGTPTINLAYAISSRTSFPCFPTRMNREGQRVCIVWMACACDERETETRSYSLNIIINVNVCVRKNKIHSLRVRAVVNLYECWLYYHTRTSSTNCMHAYNAYPYLVRTLSLSHITRYSSSFFLSLFTPPIQPIDYLPSPPNQRLKKRREAGAAQRHLPPHIPPSYTFYFIHIRETRVRVAQSRRNSSLGTRSPPVWKFLVARTDRRRLVPAQAALAAAGTGTIIPNNTLGLPTDVGNWR